jgi:hypothetical protein
MNAKLSNPVITRTFKFDVDAGKVPAKTESKDVRTTYYDMRAGLKIETLLDTLESCKTNADRESCVITWIGDSVDNDYSLGRVARAHASYRPEIDPVREENKVKNAVKAYTALTQEQRAEMLATLQSMNGEK